MAKVVKTLEEKRAYNREAQKRFWSKFTPEEAAERRKQYSKKNKEGSQDPSPEVSRAKRLIVRAYDEITKSLENRELLTPERIEEIETYIATVNSDGLIEQYRKELEEYDKSSSDTGCPRTA